MTRGPHAASGVKNTSVYKGDVMVTTSPTLCVGPAHDRLRKNDDWQIQHVNLVNVDFLIFVKHLSFSFAQLIAQRLFHKMIFIKML